MKVRDLIAYLQTVDQDYDVKTYNSEYCVYHDVHPRLERAHLEKGMFQCCDHEPFLDYPEDKSEHEADGPVTTVVVL